MLAFFLAVIVYGSFRVRYERDGGGTLIQGVLRWRLMVIIVERGYKVIGVKAVTFYFWWFHGAFLYFGV